MNKEAATILGFVEKAMYLKNNVTAK